MIAFLLTGCSVGRAQTQPSFDQRIKQAKTAILKERIFEAKYWAGQALNSQPHNLEAQRLMASVISREIARERLLSATNLPEEKSTKEKNLEVKIWLERSKELLRMNEFDESLKATEYIFRLDPDNLEASKLVDEIKEKARRQGKDEILFMDRVYQQETERRIQQYLKRAEESIQTERWGAARFVVEKILILDPKNAEGQRLLTALNRKEEMLGASIISDSSSRT